MYVAWVFQSTRPMRGATLTRTVIGGRALHFNPRAPCGARQQRAVRCRDRRAISIHAPHAGRDGASREPAAISAISIHAPHAGRDLFLARVAGAPADFNPRAPCGARQQRAVRCRDRRAISIHAPHAGRDLCWLERLTWLGHFNPRAPCGARRSIQRASGNFSHFNPRAPCGARLILGPSGGRSG